MTEDTSPAVREDAVAPATTERTDRGEAIELALCAARAADEKLATDVMVLEVADVLGVCDDFVLATARNERQVKAVVDGVEESVRRYTGRSPLSVEGGDARRWVLLDYGDVVVHVFHVDERSYYRLERLYGDVPRIEWRPGEGASERDGAETPEGEG